MGTSVPIIIMHVQDAARVCLNPVLHRWTVRVEISRPGAGVVPKVSCLSNTSIGTLCKLRLTKLYVPITNWILSLQWQQPQTIVPMHLRNIRTLCHKAVLYALIVHVSDDILYMCTSLLLFYMYDHSTSTTSLDLGPNIFGNSCVSHITYPGCRSPAFILCRHSPATQRFFSPSRPKTVSGNYYETKLNWS